MRLKFIHFAILLFVGILFSACPKGKNEEPAPVAPEPTTVSGSVSPYYGANLVSLENEGGSVIDSHTIVTDGNFSFPNVSPGTYYLSVKTNTLYFTPARTRVDVISGTPNAGNNITLAYNASAQTGLISYTLDGSPTQINYNSLSATYTANVFGLGGTTQTSPSYYSFKLDIQNFSGVSTYSLFNSPSYLSLFYYTSVGNIGGHWSTNNGGNGSVNVTSFNSTARTVSGTFTSTLAPQGASIGTKTINGSFANIVY